MRIAVNARMLTQRKPGGIQTYALDVLKRITSAHLEHEFIFIVDRPFANKKLFPSNVNIVTSFPSVHPLLWFAWFEFAVPRILKKYHADIFLSLDGYASLSCSTPTILAIYDLNFLHEPKELPGLVSAYYNYFFPKYAKKATAILTTSEYSRQDIIDSYKIDKSKITVTGAGAGREFFVFSPDERRKAQKIWAQGMPYFITVGAIHARKNPVRLILAFEQFKKRTNSPAKLIFAGPKLFRKSGLLHLKKVITHWDDIIFLGAVSQEQLIQIYNGAAALLFVSKFEGFGIPALEAMNCDVPVVASNCTSLPEVCGDAALLVDPFSVDSICDAMEKIYDDEQMRSRLIRAGHHQREMFSWDKTAEIVWKTIESVYGDI
ncbi:MAG: glycosyltransferase family 1 protein [Victivallaceae bacterium]|nr:glycosyltransferase family 1 protein [Victivallaceae bacterium]